MTWLRVSSCLFALSLLVAPTLTAVCPGGCVCNTTRDGLHRATCSNLGELYKFTLRQKHHNINILDLSHNNITKLNHELDRLTEIVTLDLSTNGIQHLNKFLHNSKKLVHLNLANNRIQSLSLTHLPTSVSSLDLTNNLLQNVPSDIGHLSALEHLELEGNPIDCSCDNIVARDQLLLANVFIDNVKCVSPEKNKGRTWLELKTKDICKVPKQQINYFDMMMGDQPIDAIQVGEETTALKSMPLVAKNDLEDGNVIQGHGVVDDDDSMQFMKVGHFTTTSSISMEGSGSGDGEINTVTENFLVPRGNSKLSSSFLSQNSEFTTEDPIYGSGEGSGEGSGIVDFTTDDEFITETTTPVYIELNTNPVQRFFKDNFNESTTEFPIPLMPTVYQGDKHWISNSDQITVTEKATTSSTPRDTTVSEPIRVTHASEVLGQPPSGTDGPVPQKTGTYVCVAIIIVLLVGLIGFAIIKSHMRKRRDRRILRQQKRDIENASKEMVDMNKSLLGKPALIDNPVEKKLNGKYELVPTHESHQKKSENVDVSNGINHNNRNGTKADSPRDTNQNKSSSRDNNLNDDIPNVPQDISFESATSPDSRKDTHSLSSEDIFVPINDEETPRLNSNRDSDVSQPLINGDQNTDSDFLSPSREYVPVYSPDMGRVRIKLTETPKPKTPILVTRSRSNAGDIIITPAGDINSRKTTT